MAVVSYVRLKMTKNALLKNSDTPVGVYILAGNFEFIDPQEGLEIISHFSSENQSNEKVAYIKEMFTHQLATEKGKPFTDIQLPTLQGDEAKLSDYAGKGFPVLLYYWSSESRASISNIPFMKSLWQRYSPQGLRIVAISLDTQKSLWKKTVETNELNWIQLSDLKGWNSPSLTLYGVSSFPYSVLIGQEGKILSKGEKGENLQKAIERSLIPSTKE